MFKKHLEMRFTPQICCATKVLSEIVRKKFTKADVIKRMMKEQKACFGALLETKREKTRRLKLEKKGAIAPANAKLSGDSELAWILRVSDSQLRLVKIDPYGKLPVPAVSPKKTDSAKKDVELSRVQRRIIRKTSGSKVTESKMSLSESVVNTDNRLVENPINEKCISPCNLKSQTTSTSEHSELMENKQIRVQSQEEKTRSILLPCKDILDNISKARLCYEEHDKCAMGHGSEILSISWMENKEYLKFPSVTHILNATMSDNAKKMLELWMARMINQLGQEGFDEYKRGIIQNGKLLHSMIEGTLRKSPVDVPDELKPCFNSVKIVLDKVENVRVIESQVVHQSLGYRGVVDCVALYRGNLCLIDWKKSDKTKHLLSSTYDAPLQIASYIGALNADENYPFQIKSGLLVIAYTVGDPPTVFTLDQTKLQFYWKQWLRRLKKYYTMQNS